MRSLILGLVLGGVLFALSLGWAGFYKGTHINYATDQ